MSSLFWCLTRRRVQPLVAFLVELHLVPWRYDGRQIDAVKQITPSANVRKHVFGTGIYTKQVLSLVAIVP